MDLVVIDLKAAGPAIFVVTGTAVDGRFSGNVLDLVPGAPRRVTFKPLNPSGLREAELT